MTYDAIKLNNNHTVALVNGEMGQIEQFYEFNSKKYAVIKLLKVVPFNFKIYQANKDLAVALLKINECLLFCNLSEDRTLTNVDEIKEKVLLIDSKINPKTSYFVTKVVLRHD
jgi:hypothetical protein